MCFVMCTLDSSELTSDDRATAGSLEVTTLKYEDTYRGKRNLLDWWRTLPERQLGL
jgi:hypothetical protein